MTTLERSSAESRTGGTYTPNTQLTTVLDNLRLSNKGLARLMWKVSREDGGEPVSPDGSTIARYKSGQHQPSVRSCQVMVKVLEQLTGHPVSPADIGYSEQELSLATFAYDRHDLSGVFFPSRLTFAGVCIWCQHRGCTSERCNQRHLASRWLVCPTCDGAGIGCDCTFGMVMATPAATTAPRLKVVSR
ncbi:Uncharacterised protein [Nocardia otitidiscaviarum]|uniref:Uncharacterized protein n=1 Tax=Nocardia otitidiscaviarum TaxID=1823 RepID=A0A378YBB3_9NOCA|nr:hypothetical protein [Nocardia otitidiscaviarum]SUA73667.1 Uncharacterised protein [Nocardia otitidiscaviarum]